MKLSLVTHPVSDIAIKAVPEWVKKIPYYPSSWQPIGIFSRSGHLLGLALLGSSGRIQALHFRRGVGYPQRHRVAVCAQSYAAYLRSVRAAHSYIERRWGS